MQIPIACLLRGFASALPSTLSYYSGLAGICQHVFWSFFDKIWKQRSNEHKIQGDSRDDKIYALLLWLAAAVWLQNRQWTAAQKAAGDWEHRQPAACLTQKIHRVYLKRRKYRLFLQAQRDFALKSLGIHKGFQGSLT